MLKDLLRTAQLGPADVGALLDLARDHRADPRLSRGLLAGETVLLHFDKPSTRTRLSFETAVARLGGVPVATRREDLQLGRGETIEDTARVVSRFARAFVIRTFADADVARFAAAATIPVINALTDEHHPCQSLADLLTLRDHFGHLRGLRVAYVGDGNNVAHSLLEACVLAGMDVRLASPLGHAVKFDVLEAARATAAWTGARVRFTSDPAEAADGADAVYTDTWISMHHDDEERAERRRRFAPYRVDAALLGRARAHAVFLHCLPAHRGEEVAADVLDGPQSLAFEQAANRLFTAAAVLEALVTGRLAGLDVPRPRPAVTA